MCQQINKSIKNTLCIFKISHYAILSDTAYFHMSRGLGAAWVFILLLVNTDDVFLKIWDQKFTLNAYVMTISDVYIAFDIVFWTDLRSDILSELSSLLSKDTNGIKCE